MKLIIGSGAERIAGGRSVPGMNGLLLRAWVCSKYLWPVLMWVGMVIMDGGK